MWCWCDKTQKWPDSPHPLYTFETSGMCLMLSFCLFPLVTGKYFCAFESFSGQSGLDHVLKLYMASECFLWVCSQDDFCVSANGYVWSWWSCKCSSLPMQPSYAIQNKCRPAFHCFGGVIVGKEENIIFGGTVDAWVGSVCVGWSCCVRNLHQLT